MDFRCGFLCSKINILHGVPTTQCQSIFHHYILSCEKHFAPIIPLHKPQRQVCTTTFSSRSKLETISLMLWLGIVWTLKYNRLLGSNEFPHLSFIPTHDVSPVLYLKLSLTLKTYFDDLSSIHLFGQVRVQMNRYPE